MINLIKNEFIKNRLILWIGVNLLFPILVFILVKYFIIDPSYQYSQLPKSTYTYIIFYKIYLLGVLPIQVIVQCTLDSLIETVNDGWSIVMFHSNKLIKLIKVKFLLTSLYVGCSYLTYITIVASLLYGRGIISILNDGIIASLASCLCFLPVAFAIQICTLLIDSVSLKVSTCVGILLATIASFQTTINIYFPTTYYFTIAQSFKNGLFQSLFCISALLIEYFVFPIIFNKLKMYSGS